MPFVYIILLNYLLGFRCPVDSSMLHSLPSHIINPFIFIQPYLLTSLHDLDTLESEHRMESKSKQESFLGVETTKIIIVKK